MVQPCNHFCICRDCAVSMAERSATDPNVSTYRRCPVCRSQVTGTQIIYLA